MKKNIVYIEKIGNGFLLNVEIPNENGNYETSKFFAPNTTEIANLVTNAFVEQDIGG